MTCSQRSWVPKARTPKNMGDGVGVPAFGEHGDRDDAADGIAEAALFADGVHDLPEEILVGEVLGLAAVAGTFDDLAAETVDLVGGHVAEVIVQCLAGFELLAVDQEGPGAGKLVAVFVEIPEQGQPPDFERRRTVVVLPVETGDIVVDKLGGGGVVADDDETGRNLDAAFLPEVVGLCIVAVEGFQGGLELGGMLQRVEDSCFAPAFLGHLLAGYVPRGSGTWASRRRGCCPPRARGAV